MRRMALLLLLMMLAAACQPAAQDDTLPTLAELPSQTATDTPTNTPAPTDTPQPTSTSTSTDTPEATATETSLPTITPTASVTVDLTLAAVGTGTAQVVEAPVLATLTPAPEGANVRPTSTGTPEIVADVVITEAQYQEEVDRLIASVPDIELADVNFVPDGIVVEMRASGGEAITVGTVRYEFRLEGDERAINNFLIIQPVNVDEFEMASGEDPSDGFVDVAYGDMFQIIFEAFDFILSQRLGEGQHDLEFITITDDVIAVTLFVPES